ncbi:Uncharacterised protein [Acinetobacter baumannii]|nr:Uncharacterised protein [Acinetobacter baumannii]
MGFFLNLDDAAERRQRGLRQREVDVVAQRLDVDQHIALGGRRQPFAERRERLQLCRALAAGEIVPDVVAESDHRAEARIGELLLQLAQRLTKLFAALAQIGEFALYAGFHKNGETAVLQQNAALNLCHVVILNTRIRQQVRYGG